MNNSDLMNCKQVWGMCALVQGQFLCVLLNSCHHMIIISCLIYSVSDSTPNVGHVLELHFINSSAILKNVWRPDHIEKVAPQQYCQPKYYAKQTQKTMVKYTIECIPFPKHNVHAFNSVIYRSKRLNFLLITILTNQIKINVAVRSEMFLLPPGWSYADQIGSKTFKQRPSTFCEYNMPAQSNIHVLRQIQIDTYSNGYLNLNR